MSDLKLSKVFYLEEFEKLLKKLKIPRNEICIIGSSVFALMGIKNNGDIEFVASKKIRKKINRIADEGNLATHVIKKLEFFEFGKIIFSENIHSSRYDRYQDLGFTDEDLIFNPENHIEINGFKFLRPEIAFSLKILDRREKDIEHIRIIENSGLFNNKMWDWNKVVLVEPWNKKITLLNCH